MFPPNLMPTPVFRLLTVLALALSTTFANADEIIVDGGENRVAVGDFDCTGCASEVTNAFSMFMSQTSGQVTAGELWQFFDRQGIDRVEQLTFCLDLQPNQQPSSDFGLSSFKLQIQDPAMNGNLITNVSFGENSLIVPEYEISSFKPEARLQVSLGYDFMKRFTANSQEVIHLDFASNDSASGAPSFSVEGGNEMLSSQFNLPMLLGFVTFWVMVFVLLSRVTRPKQETIPASISTNAEQVLSA
ncbi:MAG: hypothetical protein AAFN77_17385 [Planctomycetota bacterium]